MKASRKPPENAEKSKTESVKETFRYLPGGLRQTVDRGVMRSITVALPVELIHRLDTEIDRVQYGKLSRSGAIEQIIREGLDKMKFQEAG